MFIWLTLLINLAAGALFSEFWFHEKDSHIVRILICAAVGASAYGVLVMFWSNGAFLCALLLGQLACLVYDAACRLRKILLPEFCMFLGFDAIMLPLCLCDGDVWKYAVYPSALLLCIAMIPISIEKQNRPIVKTTDFETEKKPQYWLISCVPCFAVAVEAAVSIAARQMSVVSAIVMSCAFVVLFLLSLWLQKEIVERLNAAMLNEALTRWQKESRDYMNTIRSQRHDFNLHLHAVSGLVSSGKYDECQQYIKKLVSEAADVNDIMPVSDAVVGSMLYNMREEARLHGSDILYHITYDMEDILCNGFECNKIIGNLLQNAIDALQTDEDRAHGIRLSIFKRCGNTVIISENRFNGDPNRIARVFEPGYSTKKNHDGIGLSMILRTVERYGGRIYPEFEDDKIRFVVNIPNKVRLDINPGEEKQ
ncbi:MAG: GHKL domain-containing protein [Ruminococcus sp.]|nr:GHKL domain-containing protein [Ruminococcus sp.]